MTAKQPVPILFLDIDGVLNNRLSVARIDRACCLLLAKIIEATGCQLVISSTWRHMLYPSGDEPAMCSFRGFAELLRTHGVYGAHVIGATAPDLDEIYLQYTRGEQCRQWLRDNRVHPVGKFCALDDERDGFDDWGIPLVATDPMRGLTDAEAQRVIAVLRSEE